MILFRNVSLSRRKSSTEVGGNRVAEDKSQFSLDVKQKYTFFGRKSTRQIAKVSPSNHNCSFRIIEPFNNNNLVDVGFIKGLDKYNMPRPGDVMVPVPQIMEAAEEVSDLKECVQNHTPELLVDVPVPQIIEAALEVDAPQECVQDRTPEKLVGAGTSDR